MNIINYNKKPNMLFSNKTPDLKYCNDMQWAFLMIGGFGGGLGVASIIDSDHSLRMFALVVMLFGLFSCECACVLEKRVKMWDGKNGR
jgi:hypothetical protein